MKKLSKHMKLMVILILLSLVLIGLIALLFINNNSNNNNYQNEYRRLSHEDEFDNHLIPSFLDIIDKAVKEKNYSACYEIPFNKSIILGDMIFSSEKYFIECISDVALEIDNPEVCDRISEVSMIDIFSQTKCKSTILIKRAVLNGVKECYNSDDQDAKDYCFEYFAGSNSDSSLCEKIDNNAKRSKCAYMLGIKHQDISLCEIVVRKGNYSELSEYYYCLDAVIRNYEELDTATCKQIAGIPLGNKGLVVYDQRDYCFYYLAKNYDPKYCSEIANLEVAINCLRDGMYVGPSYYSAYLHGTYIDIFNDKDLAEDKIYINEKHGFKFIKPEKTLVVEEFLQNDIIYLMSPENYYLFNENNKNCTDGDPETPCVRNIDVKFIHIDIQNKAIDENKKTNIESILVKDIEWEKYIRDGDVPENIAFEAGNNNKYVRITSNYQEEFILEFLTSFEFVK